MAMITMLSAKAAPGVTTTVALLASVWPAPVLAIDADPAGGDMATGWLGGTSVAGLTPTNRGLLSFTMDSRLTGRSTPGSLGPHLQPVADAPNCRLLAGLTDPAQAKVVAADDGWLNLARALAAVSKPRPHGVDVVVDCGRFGPNTPLPLLAAADLILITVRPQRRYVSSARFLAEKLRPLIEPKRLGLAICGTDADRVAETQVRIGLLSAIRLPDDLLAARVFSDGTRRPSGLHRTRLIRTAVSTAAQLHEVLNQPGHPSPFPVHARLPS